MIQIQANELRIGNMVSIIGITPIQIDAQRILSIENGGDDYKPIPITEEWLLKFGFKKWDRSDYMTLFLSENDENEFSRQVIDFWFGDDDFQAAELCRSGVCFKRVKMKYVHQLQNLYFSITGEELTLSGT